MGEREALSLRLSPEVVKALKRCAEDDLRSVNATIEVMVREGLKRRGYLKPRQATDPA
ncbi:hypothetical protein OCUBac02_53300 (plasmid) [Bosea sp. ANAM02]|nr:hypothetical protein OCUBac02_53300 [Bosea sp. ANAM02]